MKGGSHSKVIEFWSNTIEHLRINFSKYRWNYCVIWFYSTSNRKIVLLAKSICESQLSEGLPRILLNFSLRLGEESFIFPNVIHKLCNEIHEFILYESNIKYAAYDKQNFKSSIKYENLKVTSMLVTNVGDAMCWWQLYDVCDGLAILVTNIHFLFT